MTISRRRLLAGSTALLLLPAIEAWSKPGMPVFKGGLIDVRDFGAKGDGLTIDSPAIDRAIDAAATRGGGTVFSQRALMPATRFTSRAW